MFLKDYLKKTYYKATLDNDNLTKESVVNKWVHRFGFNSLNDLLIQNQVLKKERDEEGNQKQIDLKFSENLELQENVSSKATHEKTLKNNKSTNKYYQFGEDIDEVQKLPLPNIDKLRKWIKNDKKAS